MNIEFPVQQQATSTKRTSNSLYQQSIALLIKLYYIPNFEAYIFPFGIPFSKDDSPPPEFDPVALLWQIFRLGAPLCVLINQLKPRQLLDVPNITGLDRNTQNNTFKKGVFYFLNFCKKELNMDDKILFGVSELYSDNTSGFVKAVNVVSEVIDMIEARGMYPPKRRFPFSLSSNTANGTDNRSKLLNEILNTERKYINSLEDLQKYSNEIKNKQLLNKDQLQELFANLPELLDFQRKFLFSMEATLALGPDEHRLGILFAQNEMSFDIYEAFCGNYKRATHLIEQESASLQSVDNIIDHKTQLPALLIQPVQRICRYPLLLKELIKLNQGRDYAYMDELIVGLESAKRVTGMVNEQKRMEENLEIKEDLAVRILDFKGLQMADFGDLLLSDKFPMNTGSEQKEYTLFLFDRILICCKETKKKIKRKGGKDYQTAFTLKGNIYISSIVGVGDTSDPGAQVFCLQVYWKDGNLEETFVLNCRNIEQVALWQGRLNALIRAEMDRRRSIAENLDKHGLRSKMFDDKDDEYADIDYSPVMRTGRRSDAYSTGSAASAASFNHQLNHNYPGPQNYKVSRSSSNPSNQHPSYSQYPPPANNPTVPNEYVNSRKSSPAPARSHLYEQTLYQAQKQAPSGYGSWDAPTRPLSENAKSFRIDHSTPPPAMPTSQRKYTQQQQSSSFLPPNHPPPSSPTSYSYPKPYDDRSYEPITPPISGSVSPKLASNRVEPSRGVREPRVSSSSSSRRDQSTNRNGETSRISSESSRPRNSGESTRTNESSYRPTEAETRLRARMEQLKTSPRITAQPLQQTIQPPSGPPQSYPPRSSSTSSSSSSSSNSIVKVKAHYGNDIFVFAVHSVGCGYNNLLAKVQRKVKLLYPQNPTNGLKMRYKDSIGDVITILTDGDVVMALENGKLNGVLNLYI